MAEAYDTINGEDILSNSLRSIKQYIPRKGEEVQKHMKYIDKDSKTAAEERAYDMGYLKALTELGIFIKSQGV